ncbi:unnamed protein product [Adineta steineri]|uniref:protein-tyrosine-phosphatase n=1 Tax=Adineta steineri TaxID=433720 RepID=A0A814IHX0_9BILA|nr:unnamed protein product [Adineta steineri]
MKQKYTNPLIIIYFIYQFWIFTQGTSLTSSFAHNLRNLTIIYKPNAFIYHFCQTSNSINAKRIRWHYESFHDSNNESNTHCKHLFNNSDCFDFYYGPSTSVLVVKEPDMFIGQYTCHININSTYEVNSIAWIDVKLPSYDKNANDEYIEMYNESELGKLANYHNVPFILDENDLTSFGKRVQIGGIFHTKCISTETSYPISFTWIQLKSALKGIKTMRFIHNDEYKIKIINKKYSSSLYIYSVDFFDHGDYICIASNVLGRSFSSIRSLIVSERMVLPHIHGNLLNNSYFDLQHSDTKTLTCIADGYPNPDVAWIRVSDSISLARSQSYAILKFINEMHGVNKYMCEARNKHGFTVIFISVIIPDINIQPVLDYTDVQSRNVNLIWHILNENTNRYNHFIVYYRTLNYFHENINEHEEIINIENYKQILVDLYTKDLKFAFRVVNLIPFTNYEFRVKGFNGVVASNYSNPIFIKTLESLPQKIENLHGYVWNKTSVYVHWTPPNSTNGPNFYYILYYTINTSIPFDQWPKIKIYTYPFYILPISISINSQVFIRVATVNAKGLVLSDFQMINYTLSNSHLFPAINNFHCSFDNQNQLIYLEWLIYHNSYILIENHVLYYYDTTQNNDNLIRILKIPNNSLIIDRHSTYDLLKYKFNTSLFDLNSNEYYILRLHLAIIDQSQNQLPMTPSPIYCTFTKKSDKDFIRLSWTKPDRLSTVYGYTIKYRPINSNQSWIVRQTNNTQILLNELRPITKYEIILQAYTNASYTDSSGPSTRIEAITDETVPLVAPINVSAHMINQTTANISWIYPLDSNNPDDIALLGGMIKGFYVIVFAPDSIQPPIVHRNYEGTIGTQYWDIVGNLTPGATYHAQVKAFTKKGDGKPSVAYIFTVPKDDLQHPPLMNLTAYVVNVNTLSVTWDLPLNVNDINKIYITVTELGQINRTIQMQSFDNTIKKLDIQINDKDPHSIHSNTTVHFSARYSDQNGQNSSIAEYQLNINILNPSPRDVRVARINDTTIQVFWSPIYYPPVERYIVHYNDKAENKKENQWALYAPINPSATTAIISGLKPAAMYNVRVNAEFSNTNMNDPSYASGTSPREGDLSDIQVADVFHRTKHVIQYDNQLSRPYNMSYTDLTSNSVKLLFKFNEMNLDPRRQIQKLEVHYEGIQNYVDSLGTARSTSHHNSAGLITLPPTQGTREWLVTGLVPNTRYTLNLTGTITASDQSTSKIYSQPATINFSTDYDAPPYVDRPEQDRRNIINGNNQQVYFRLHRASTKNGPIDRYYIVINLFEQTTYQSYVPQEGRRECCYTAAVFNESQLPEMFILGDGKETRDWEPFSGRTYNNSPLISTSRIKLVSWGFNRRRENLTTSSSSISINVPIKSPQTSNEDTFHNLLWIFGIIFLLFLILIIVIIFSLKFNRTKRKSLTPPPECVPFDLTPKVLTMEMQMPILPPTISPASSGEPVEIRRIQPLTNYAPIPIEEFATHLEHLKASDNYKFSQEYESIDPGEQFSWENSKLECNKTKNRYANVVAYDHSRVILRPIDGINGSDYINANYLDGYRKQNAYIATQGPLPNTFADFWRMIWETNSDCIVMMTKLEERNRLKCDQYWPSRGMETYGSIQVTLTDFIELASYSIRTFTIAWTGHPEKREIRHCQFTAWPDHGILEHATSFLMFVRRVKTLNPPDSGPVVVHCSAGVGRTGCFIVIDALLEKLKHEKTIDIYGHVTLLRAQRNYIVQTEEQYIFIYEAINEAIQSGYTEVAARNLLTHLQRLLQPLNDSSLTEMELEFKRLANMKALPSKFISANHPSNKFKNRLVNILPYENTRVCLSPIRGIDGSDYINASYIDGYRFRNGYIATQGPLNETIDDFWRMIWEHNVTIIVMLTKLKEMGREKCSPYWPIDQSIRYGYFIIDPLGEYHMSQYLLSEFKLTDTRDGQSRTIRHFLYTEWPEQGVPKVGEGFIDFIGQVHKTKEGFGQDGPIVVHCSAGVGRTGIFLTLSIVLERIRYEGVVDVFQTVKLLRTQRPALVQTEDQYQFCYRSALEYLSSFDNLI